ncbi:PREDICTED: uncharacterized protein LOC105557233 [Vollenhovia emeryi]|uniref:uncharacterized protein LOC105557233 n=1 Tax=Vollenhovia emeryi TaxID=411798 RepID=UPI0005F3A3DA|nr:PREDICTED: uncharacterized protein LOC105557233 [Vollenhovia emeryi]
MEIECEEAVQSRSSATTPHETSNGNDEMTKDNAESEADQAQPTLCVSTKDFRNPTSTETLSEFSESSGKTDLSASSQSGDCETGRGEMLVTCRDLQGFWDMAYLVVENCDSQVLAMHFIYKIIITTSFYIFKTRIGDGLLHDKLMLDLIIVIPLKSNASIGWRERIS